MNTNQCILEGNLTRDPEIKEAGNSQVANFGIAVNKRKFNTESKQWEDGDAGFYEIEAWGFMAERVMQLEKGNPVIVVGELRFSQWEKDGQKRNAVRVSANTVGLQLRNPNGGTKGKSSEDDEEIPF